MIPISNDPSASNRMALIRTLTVSIIAFERKKEELYGFQQTDYSIDFICQKGFPIKDNEVKIKNKNGYLLILIRISLISAENFDFL